jgi:hypothetical protein
MESLQANLRRRDPESPKSPTMKDVAYLAEVSTATVSMVVNNDPRICPSTRERVLAVASRLNYQVNEYARALSLRKKEKRTAPISNSPLGMEDPRLEMIS